MSQNNNISNTIPNMANNTFHSNMISSLNHIGIHPLHNSYIPYRSQNQSDNQTVQTFSAVIQNRQNDRLQTQLKLRQQLVVKNAKINELQTKIYNKERDQDWKTQTYKQKISKQSTQILQQISIIEHKTIKVQQLEYRVKHQDNIINQLTRTVGILSESVKKLTQGDRRNCEQMLYPSNQLVYLNQNSDQNYQRP